MQEVLLRTSNGRVSIVIDNAFCKSLGVSQMNYESSSLFIASWLVLLSDSPLCPTAKPPGLYRKFIHSLIAKGLKAMVVEYSSLAHELVSRPTLMGSGSLIGDWIPEFEDTPVFYEYIRYTRTGCPELLKYIYTFLNFGKKLEYEDASFNEVALRDWLGIEKKLSGLIYDPNDISALKLILGTLLPRFSWRDFRPKFGPGAVQERGVYGRLGKLRNFQYDPIIDRFLFGGHSGCYGTGQELGMSADRVIPDTSVWHPSMSVSSRVARLRFVPKSLKVARSICMEPNTLMYFQQGVSRRIVEIVERESMYGRFIRIGDQTRNQVLAEFGSYTGDIDTLDLSAASDSVSLRLVKEIFPPSWLIPMLATRSHSAILPDGSTRRLEKFAPMGSALCFPTQCLIFATVCIYAACLQTYDECSPDIDFHAWLTPGTVRHCVYQFRRDTAMGVAFQPLAIYGDDICVDSRLTPIVKSILARLGFVVNEEKSFTGSQAFRESCGKFYLNGSDITPLYFRIKGVRESLTPNHVASQVHLINECWSAKYKNLYRFLHNSLMTWDSPYRRLSSEGKNPIPYVPAFSDQFGIWCASPVNSHLDRRTNADYQREEVRGWTISYDRIEKCEVKLLSTLDAYEYMRWWAGRDAVSTTEDLPSSVQRHDTRAAGLRWRWMPTE